MQEPVNQRCQSGETECGDDTNDDRTPNQPAESKRLIVLSMTDHRLGNRKLRSTDGNGEQTENTQNRSNGSVVCRSQQATDDNVEEKV